MGFGEIVKKAWRITWRHKALWVLGIFAGVSGCSGSAGGNSSYDGGSGGGNSVGRDFTAELGRFADVLKDNLGSILLIAGVLFLIGVIFWLLGIAARAGLIHGANEAEEGRPVRLGDAWGVGFSKWGGVFLVELLLKFPIFAITIGIFAGVSIPLIRAIVSGNEPDPVALLGPMCGVLALGVPVLLVLSYVFGIMHLTALRFLVLDNQGATAAIGSAWQSFRNRFKDHFLMYLFNWLLNIAASTIFAIPIAIITVAVLVPAAISTGATDNLRPILVGVAALVAAIIPLSILFTGVWGTYTSALWTIFFRRLTGREVVAVQPPAPVNPAATYSAAPAAPYPAPPVTPPAPFEPQSPAPPVAPLAPEPPVEPPA